MQGEFHSGLCITSSCWIRPQDKGNIDTLTLTLMCLARPDPALTTLSTTCSFLSLSSSSTTSYVLFLLSFSSIHCSYQYSVHLLHLCSLSSSVCCTVGLITSLESCVNNDIDNGVIVVQLFQPVPIFQHKCNAKQCEMCFSK